MRSQPSFAVTEGMTKEDIAEMRDMYHGAAKDISTTVTALDGLDGEDEDDGHKMTQFDQFDMNRMNKKQEMRRVFRQFSILSFTCVVMATWEFLLCANSQGLTDGGLSGLFWSYLWTLVGFGLIIASMAEMASMAPTSGGQYHWVSGIV